MNAPKTPPAPKPLSASLTGNHNTPQVSAIVSTTLAPTTSAALTGPYTFYDAVFERRKHKKGKFEQDLVFVIMSFSRRSASKMLDIYSAIKDECAKLSLRATRVDENVGGGFILGETIRLIEKAEFIICDLTHERPNVYYELGYAHGVGNRQLNILMIAREGTNVHFDISPFRVQFYRSTEHLRTIIAGAFKEMVRLNRELDMLSAPAPLLAAKAPYRPSEEVSASAEPTPASDDFSHNKE